MSQNPERFNVMDKKSEMQYQIKSNNDGTYTAYIANQEKVFADLLEAAEWCSKIRGESDG